MKKVIIISVILSLAAGAALLSGCKVDDSIDFDNEFDSSITVGDYFAKRLESQRYVLEDLIDLDDIIAHNPGLSLSADATWDIIESLDLPLTMPDMTFGPFQISSLGLDTDNIDMLMGGGALHMILEAKSTLPVDIDITIDFIHSQGPFRVFDKPIRIFGADNGGGTGEGNEVRVEMTEEHLENLADIVGIEGSVDYPDSSPKVKLRRDLSLEFVFTVEKTGGLNLDFGSGDEPVEENM